MVCAAGGTSSTTAAALLQVREALVGHTSVLAGPSGVGKSSIINAVRAEAFDSRQRARLAEFERKMDEEEILWRQYREGSDESGESKDDNAPCSSAPEHSTVEDGGVATGALRDQPGACLHSLHKMICSGEYLHVRQLERFYGSLEQRWCWSDVR